MSRFILNPAVLISPTTEGYVAYDTANERFHELNPMAALLVELCDGSRTIAEVTALAAPFLPPESEAAVLEWIDIAQNQGVLVECTEGLAIPQEQELTVPILQNLAGRLRDDGKTQAAYLCQERAAELQPEDSDVLRELGELAHIIGRREAARAAYEKYLALVPDDAEIGHLLTSLRDDAPPDRVPTACIQQLYRRFSSFYETNMCDELSYEGPAQLRDVIDETLGDRRGLSILDLGCGTGLAGLAVVERASRLVGIDLSPEMIEQARARGIYDELHVAEVATWLGACKEQFDLILACDTLIYFGDLRQVIDPAAQHLAPNGVIAFSVERAASGMFRLTDNGRYVHHPNHVLFTAQACHLKLAHQTEAFLRMEYGQPVTGLFVCLRPQERGDHPTQVL